MKAPQNLASPLRDSTAAVASHRGGERSYSPHPAAQTMTLFAVLVVALAASCINVGKALQKEGTKRLPRFSMDRRVITTYFNDATWSSGMGVDVCGGLLMVCAISIAPVSLVQPVAAGGVAVLAVFSHFRLNEKLENKAWAGVCATVVGTVGIGYTAEEQPPDGVSVFRIYLGAVVILAVLVYTTVLNQESGSISRQTSASKRLLGLSGGRKKIVGVGGGMPHHMREAFLKNPSYGQLESTRGGSTSTNRGDEVTYGFRSGVFFSLSASACKVGFLFNQRGYSVLFALVGLGCSVLLTGAGLVSQTKGLKDGNSVVVCTIGNVSQMVVAVFFGVCVLGEKLPVGIFGRLGVFFISWSLILAGVLFISGVRPEDLPDQRALEQKWKQAKQAGLGGLGGLSGLTKMSGSFKGGSVLPIHTAPSAQKKHDV